jgi:putative ABC transport system permease protein
MVENMIGRLVYFDLKKKVINNLFLGLLILISIIFFVFGTMIFFNVNKVVDFSISKTNGADNYIVLSNNDEDIESCNDFLDSKEECDEYEKTDILFILSNEVESKQNKISMNFIIEQEKDGSEIGKIEVVEECDIDENWCYIPISLRTYGYALGDKLKFENGTEEYSIQIKGFYETSAFGLPSYGCVRLITDEKAYELLNENFDEFILYKIRLHNEKKSQDFDLSLVKELNKDKDTVVYSTDYDKNMTSATYMVSIVAIVLILFAFILFLLCLIVVYFTIKSGIEDDIVDIGILENLGYLPIQIRSIYLIKILLVNAIACAIGFYIVFVLKNNICNIMTDFSGVYWNNIKILKYCIYAFIGSSIFLTIIVLASTRRIMKYPVVDALKNLIKDEQVSFLRYHINKSHFGINRAIGINNIVSSLRQSIIVFLIYLIVGICTSVSGLIYYNMVLNNEAFYNIIGQELAHIVVTVSNVDDVNEIEEIIQGMENVEHTSMHDMKQKVCIGDREINTIISNDFSKMELLDTYEGKLPTTKEEVVLGGTLADKLDKKIGDKIEITYKDTSYEYYISGFVQTIIDSGNVVILTEKGIINIDENYTRNSIYVYLNNSDAIDDDVKHIEDLTDEYEGVTVVNYDVTAKNAVSIYEIISGYVATVIFFISIIIVMLIIVLLVNDNVTRKKKEFGIQKALGYTTFQMILQLEYTFIPIAVLGILAGIVLGGKYINLALSSILYNTGVAKLEFAVEKRLLIVIGIVVFVFSVISIFMRALKIRKISPYELFVE